VATSAWAVDLPGQKFILRPADLPPPHATRSVANNPKIIPRPPDAMPQAPRGFTVSIYADNLDDARGLLVVPNGDVFLSERKSGKITLLRDTNGDGKADQRFTFASGLKRPNGLALQGGYLYFSDQMAVYRVRYNPDATEAGTPERVTVAPDLRNSGMHATRDLAVAQGGPNDGSVFVEMGAHDNVSDYRPGAEIFRIDAKGNLTTYASGMRNPIAIAFYPGTDHLFAAVNERDTLGDQVPPDYFTYVKPGGFYGYPWSYAGTIPDPVWGPKDPGGKIASAITPDVLFPAHSAPNALVFYEGSNFPAEYKGDAFVSLRGSWNTAEPHGYKVVRIHFANGRPANGGYENFLTGFWDGTSNNPPLVWGQPTGLAVAKDGSLLVADEDAETIWRVTYTGK
jgi:glucose/arabinose dehydrogenase